MTSSVDGVNGPAPRELAAVSVAGLTCMFSEPAVPQCGPAPLVVFLHGLDEGPPADVRQALTRHGPLNPDSSACLRECLVVAPQLPVRGDNWHRCADAVDAVVRAAHADWAGDPARTYLTGFSYGGNGVFDVSLLLPHRWAALWAVDPTRAPSRPLPAPAWVSAGSAARAARREFAEADAVQNWAYEDRGLDHVGTATAAYGSDGPVIWLLRHRRPTA